jgi:hypothetical protein
MSVKVWGTEYHSSTEMQRRMGQIVADNRKYGASDDRVSEWNALRENLTAFTPTPRPQNDRPYVVLYRKYSASGHCYKGRRTFRTEADRSRWIRNADPEIAITGY